MPLPEEGLSLEDKIEVTNLMLRCGATIEELNCVRKHISAIKGGKLAKAVHPAPLTSLILSDVIGDPLDSIASGPTAPDPTTYEDARTILHKYDIWGDVPAPVRQELEKERFETPGEEDPVFEKVQNVIIGNNKKAQRAMVEKAKTMGYKSFEVTDYLMGKARNAGPRFLEQARAMSAGLERAAVVAGGETTVVVRGEGRGGRNQEMALVSLDRLEDGELFASVGTDGIDGNSHGAGALVDAQVDKAVLMTGVNPGAYLDDNDSTTFFEKTKGLLVTGPTGTNVADVQLYLVHRQ
jgi:glycerate-2-kinase